MKRRLTRLAVIASAALVSGCGLTGTWRTIAVIPEGDRFPVTSVTFDKHHRFTATSDEDGHQRTSTGEYKWNGLRLILNPSRGCKQTYRCRWRLDRTLVLTHRRAGQKVRATLERTGP